MEQSKPSRLESWKDIAAYLGRDMRTAMRWAKQGMPVHHDPGGKQGRVYAYTGELDRWREQPEAKGLNLLAATRPWWRRVPALIGAAVLPALVVVGALVVGYAVLWRSRASAPLARVEIRENKFAALDKAGRVLWTYPLPAGQDIPQGRSPGITHIGDLDGDGRNEALVSLPLAGPGPAHMAYERELYCFSETGKLLWRFDFHETLTFGSGDYGPPWFISALLPYRAQEQPVIALVLHTGPWWPAVLLILDSRGQEVGRFVNSGNIFTLSSVETPSGSVLLAGGVRNQEDEVSGMLAVLDGNHVSGSSPKKSGSRFECRSCPPGRPLRYFVFPRSELNVEPPGGGYNRVGLIVPSEDGVRVHTDEAIDAESKIRAIGIFEFSRDFRLVRLSYSDGYRELHRKLEREGKIKHPWERCPDRYGPQVVRTWDRGRGWGEIRPQTPQK